MGGKASRVKGMRAEYLLRDYFRALGWEAERVPLSGASNAMKGDVVIKKDGKEHFIEVKSRRDQFKMLYVLYEDYIRTMKDDLIAFCAPDDDFICIQMSSSFDGVMMGADVYPMLRTHPMYSKYSKTMKSLITAHDWLGGCSVLVLKSDRKPFLFVRYIR